MYKVIVLQSYVNRSLAALGAAAALFALLYAALLLLAVGHAASRTAAEREMREVAASIRALESRYFETTRAVTPERARELGFVAPAATVTVFATAASRAVTLQGLGGRESRQ